MKFNNKNIIPVVTDVSIEDEAKALIETAKQNFGKIDILILAAGISAHSLFEDF
jgi:NAD(P)-dependent dehydrogenase (short-subunit alcohol dehydrogenase family)